jgi:hypothetical protein
MVTVGAGGRRQRRDGRSPGSGMDDDGADGHSGAGDERQDVDKQQESVPAWRF